MRVSLQPSPRAPAEGMPRTSMQLSMAGRGDD